MSRYVVEYDNDTGPNDDGFWEWWSVMDTTEKREICQCDQEADAVMIAALLNSRERTHD